MATPKQVYESDVYRKASLCPGSVPWAYFLDVYEALGEALGAAEEAAASDTGTRSELIDPEPIHGWFGLTYAHYLTIPRSVLQSMPAEWQERFVECLKELDETIDWRPQEGCYWVRLKDSRGRFARDPLGDYERGRRRIPLNAPPPARAIS